jgi:acyl-CoA reductase-like NAD-dependent aldehyde dehydrogenase
VTTYESLLASITDPDCREIADPATGEVVGRVAVEAAAEPLAELLSREQGKPLNGPNARFEVGACAAWLRATAATQLPVETVVVKPSEYTPLSVLALVEVLNSVLPADVLPFGGVTRSGYGLEFGVEGLTSVAVPQVING